MPMIVPPEVPVFADMLPLATIFDFVPLENIPSFGLCSSLANPEVATATALAEGVLTPMPCIPVTTSPWFPGAPEVLAGAFTRVDRFTIADTEYTVVGRLAR